MSLADDIVSMYTNTREAYNALEELGATMPEQKNLENLTATIDTLSSSEEWDPENPTLAGLKTAIDSGNLDEIEIGTEIPDTWDGQDNPLIVGTKQIIAGVDGNKYLAVGLLRKYIEPTAQTYGTTSAYSTSSIKNYLDTIYLDKCSSTIKKLVTDVNVPYYNGSTISNVASKWFLMGVTEVYSSQVTTEGKVWEYWKNKTGFSAPQDDDTAGRVCYGRDKKAYNVWLRTAYNNNRAYSITTTGRVSNSLTEAALGVLPACYILSSNPLPEPSLDELQNAITNGDVKDKFPVGTEKRYLTLDITI